MPKKETFTSRFEETRGGRVPQQKRQTHRDGKRATNVLLAIPKAYD